MNALTQVEAGHAYKLLRPFEVRDERTGTMKDYLLSGSLLKIRKVAAEEDHVWVDGVDLPLPLNALRQHVVPVS